jgi:hypothetical protein
LAIHRRRPGAAFRQKGDGLLQVRKHGAQRASHDPSRAFPIVLLLAALFAVGGLVTHPQAVRAAAPKVVVVVGPTGSQTADYIYNAKKYASLARSYGATVYELYSPHATWSRVKTYAQGANLLIYLGHGNGWPSPYPPFQEDTKDGMGLNAYDGSTTNKYYGGNYIRSYIKLAPDAVVVLNRLCYASGNNEWGVTPDPSLSTARQRVDNFGAAFLYAGAKGVFAEGLNSVSYVITGLFKTNMSYAQIFTTAPSFTGTYYTQFWSSRMPGNLGRMDPYKPGKYYRSFIGIGRTSSTAWRTPGAG